MARKTKGFKMVSRVRENKDKDPYWLVSGSIGGKQVRREFSNRDEALRFQDQKNCELNGIENADLGNVATRLDPTQVKDAEIALAQLANEFPKTSLHDLLTFFRDVSPSLPLGETARFAPALRRLQARHPGATLTEACDFYAEAYRPTVASITLGEALVSYASDVTRRQQTKALSWWQYRSIKFATKKLEKYFGAQTRLGTITAARLHDFLAETTFAADGSENFSNKTWSNRRGYLTRFFGYCVDENWLSENPALRIRKYSKREHHKPAPVIISAKKAEEMMHDAQDYAEGRLVPYLVATLFCGIRPSAKDSEATRLRPEQVDLNRAELRMPAGKTKTRKPRVVKLQENAVEWFKMYPMEQRGVICANFMKLIKAFRTKHQLGYDVLRHTYASMLVGRNRSVADAALQAGNSEYVMWGSYLDLVDEAEAARFWSIRPKARPQNPAASEASVLS